MGLSFAWTGGTFAKRRDGSARPWNFFFQRLCLEFAPSESYSYGFISQFARLRVSMPFKWSWNAVERPRNAMGAKWDQRTEVATRLSRVSSM